MRYSSTTIRSWQISRVPCTLPSGPEVILRLPGCVGCDERHHALFRALPRFSLSRVCVLGWGVTPTALWAARSGAEVVCWIDSAAEAEMLRLSFDAADLPLPRILCAAHPEDLTPGMCSLAIVHLPRGRVLQQELLEAAGAMVAPGGKVYFVGARREGIKSATGSARALFGQAGILVRKGGWHVGMAINSLAWDTIPMPKFTSADIIVDDVPTHLVACAGVFAPDRLDEGARTLIRAMDVKPDTHVLDLGCGTGVVALAACRRGARVDATDVSARAVASARRTLEANGCPQARVHLCPGAQAIAASSIDTVVANPPFHRGHAVDFEIVELFIMEAARVLRPGGELFLVANAFLDHSHRLRRAFNSVSIVHDTGRFRVWYGRKGVR